MNNIRNKKAMVLGGTSGIGLATARLLRDQGATVIAVSRSGNIEGEHDDITVESCDVLDRKALTKLFKRHDPLDFLVCAATGGARARGPFAEMDLDEFQGSFAKLWGYTNAVRLGINALVEDGAIVLVSGSPARKCGSGMLAISTVGNAVEGFARALVPEIAPRRINVVSPGLIDTPMVPFKGEERIEHYKKATAKQPIPRAGTPEEVAQAISLTLKNAFMTGAVIDVDGGALLP